MNKKIKVKIYLLVTWGVKSYMVIENPTKLLGERPRRQRLTPMSD